MDMHLELSQTLFEFCDKSSITSKTARQVLQTQNPFSNPQISLCEGEIICSDVEVGIPEEHKRHAEEAAEALGDGIWTCMPFVHGARPREVRENEKM